MTVKLLIASTLDGYIATKEESLQWLFDVEGEGDNGYGAFYSDIDTIIMGKKTYDWLEKEQAGQWPYSDKTSYILTHQKISSTDNIVFIDKEKLTELSVNFADTDKNIWVVGGGEVIKLFIENHWVDELQVTIAPVLLGDGISLFPSGNYKEKLQLIDTKIYGQFVELHYLVKK